jgi:elongation factor Ts
VAMQIAATSPMFVSRDQVPEELLETERGIYRAQALQEGKSEQFLDKIIEGRMDKFYQAVCLLEQAYIKDSNVTIQEHLAALVGKIGENITIRRFTRYQLGEEL